jgi:hypothetical protein
MLSEDADRLKSKRRKDSRKQEELSGMWVLDVWVTRTFWIFGVVLVLVVVQGRGMLKAGPRKSCKSYLAPTADAHPCQSDGAAEKGQESCEVFPCMCQEFI